MANAPRKVFQLIGDPRTGIADDTSTNPFGEITCEMLWHQVTNEVYWYRYEFAGNLMKEGHRDTRLTDYTKNLIYILRAKDPQRWTIDALAKKFHIRRQRVLTIIALKDLEAQAIDKGELLSGPLRVFSQTLDLKDVHLDPVTGDIMDWKPPLDPRQMKAANKEAQGEGDAELAAVTDLSSEDPAAAEGRPEEAAASSSTAAGSRSRAAAAGAPAAGSEADQLSQQAFIPQLVSTTEAVQLQLLEMMSTYDYDFGKFKASMMQEVDRAEAYYTEHFAESTGVAAAAPSSAEGAGESAPPPPLVDMAGYRLQMTALVDSLEPMFESKALARERETAQMVTSTQATLDRLEAASAGGDLAAELSQLETQLLGTGESSDLLRTFFALPNSYRKMLLDHSKQIKVRLNQAGVDLVGAVSLPGELGMSRAGPTSGAVQQEMKEFEGTMVGDVYDFKAVDPRHISGVLDSAAALEEGLRGVDQGLRAAGALKQGEEGFSSLGLHLGVTDVRQVLDVARQYVALDQMLAGVKKAASDVDPRQRGKSPAQRLSELQLLEEANPELVQQVAELEAVRVLERGGDKDGAAELRATINDRLAATSRFKPLDVTNRRIHFERVNWDLVAAYIDTKVVKRVYWRGSGERLFMRLPTYPAFEGYTLQEFDNINEGEISQLNRVVAQRVDDDMWEEFRETLLYHLGVIGEGLKVTGLDIYKRHHNVRNLLNAPVLVYPLGQDDSIGRPLFVVDGDGRQRALTSDEAVFQQRRTQAYKKRLPYVWYTYQPMVELLR